MHFTTDVPLYSTRGLSANPRYIGSHSEGSQVSNSVESGGACAGICTCTVTTDTAVAADAYTANALVLVQTLMSDNTRRQPAASLQSAAASRFQTPCNENSSEISSSRHWQMTSP